MTAQHQTSGKPMPQATQTKAADTHALAPMPPALLGHIGHIKTAQDWVLPLIIWLHARPDSQQEQQRLWAQLQQQLVQHPHKQLTLSGQGLRIQLQSTLPHPELEPEPERGPQSVHDHATPRARHWGLHSLHFVAQGPGPIWPGPWPAGAQPDGQAQSQSQNTAPTSAQQLLQRLQVDPDEALVTDALLSCQIMASHGQPLGVTATFDSATGQMQELILIRLGPWLPSQSVPGQTAPSQSGGQA